MILILVVLCVALVSSIIVVLVQEFGVLILLD